MSHLNIWKEQDALNETFSHRTPKLGTIALSQSPYKLEATRDFLLALLSETAELINNFTDESTAQYKDITLASTYLDCFIWKHWAKETKDGLRWTLVTDPRVAISNWQRALLQASGNACGNFLINTPSLITPAYGEESSNSILATLEAHLSSTRLPPVASNPQLLHPNQPSGEGTIQNVWLELTDILFFLVSTMQVTGGTQEDWDRLWPQPYQTCQNFDMLLQQVPSALSVFLTSTSLEENLTQWKALATYAGLSWKKANDLYIQKLEVNKARAARGRKQVGDTLSDAENSTVK